MSETLHVVCPQCDAVNRIPASRAIDEPKCGACRRALFDGRPIELSAANFQKHIERNDIPVLVDFWAPWCGPCRAMAPAFAQAAKELEPRMRLAKVDTEKEPGLGAQFGIRSIPTLIVFKNGREVTRQSGAMSASDLSGWLNDLM